MLHQLPLVPVEQQLQDIDGAGEGTVGGQEGWDVGSVAQGLSLQQVLRQPGQSPCFQGAGWLPPPGAPHCCGGLRGEKSVRTSLKPTPSRRGHPCSGSPGTHRWARGHHVDGTILCCLCQRHWGL